MLTEISIFIFLKLQKISSQSDIFSFKNTKEGSRKMTNKFWKRAVFFFILTFLLLTMLTNVFAVENENAKYVMDAETMTTGHLGVLFIKGGTTSNGVISGGSLYFGKYDPILEIWTEEPVGETAPIAKEAALAIDDDGVPQVAYITSDNKIAYTYTEGGEWIEPVIIESNNCNDSVGVLSSPDIAIDSNGKAHITYIDSNGADNGEGTRRDDGMYATNASGDFVKTVIADGSGYSENGYTEYDALKAPVKIALSETDKQIVHWFDEASRTQGSYWYHDYTFEIKSTSHLKRVTNEGGMVYEVCSDGTKFYTLISESGKYIVLDSNTNIASTEKATSIYAADMTLSGDAICYAAISGNSLLFYQDGIFIDEKEATTEVLSGHNKCATLISGGKQFLVYTGADEEKSLVITTIEGDEVEEYVVPVLCQVTVDPNNGEEEFTINTPKGENLILSSPTTLGVETPEGTQFVGWKIGEDVYDSGDTYLVEDDFTMQAQWITIITAAGCTITEPEAGAHPDFNPVATEDSQYSVSVDCVYLIDEEETYPELDAEDTFAEGEEYWYRVVFVANDGYTFTADTVFTINDEEVDSYGSVGQRQIGFTIPVSTYGVTITPGNYMTRTSGESTQQVTIGEQMNSVVYTAEEGYCFPTTYSVASVNDVIVTRTSATQITVSGTPSADTAIILTDASEHVVGDATKENEEVPTCTEAGSYEDVYYCVVCGNEIARFHHSVEPLSHIWTFEYEWNEDNTECTATAICTRVSPHTETETVETTIEETIEANLSHDGEEVYTATFTNPIFETQSKTLPVIYQRKIFTVSFDANGGSGEMEEVEVEEGASYTLPVCRFEAPSSSEAFSKWDQGSKGSKITILSNITLIAQWRTKGAGGGGSSSTPRKTPTPTPTPKATSVPEEETHIWKIADEWAEEELKAAEEKELIPETLDNKDFTNKIDRTDFAAVAVKLYENLSGKKAEPINPNPFTDTNDEYVLKAYALGITNGTSETTFTPGAEITREQMATMLARAIKAAGIDITIDLENIELFADDEDMHEWGREAIYFMAQYGIIKGVGDNKFNALGNAKIEEAILISLRTIAVFQNNQIGG